MASKEHKIVRRAQALAELARLSNLLAERFSIEMTNTQLNNKDSELAEIQRLESINAMLDQVLHASPSEAEKPKRSVKHGAKQ